MKPNHEIASKRCKILLKTQSVGVAQRIRQVDMHRGHFLSGPFFRLFGGEGLRKKVGREKGRTTPGR